MTSRHLAQGSRTHQSERLQESFDLTNRRGALRRSSTKTRGYAVLRSLPGELAGLKSRCREARPMPVASHNYLWESASQPLDHKGAAYFRDIAFGLACQSLAH